MQVKNIMTKKPIMIDKNELAKALSVMNSKKITLCVFDKKIRKKQ